MHVNRETAAETDARLRRVIALADFVAYDGTFGFVEPFGLFRFHFPPGVDNSGFVGWLATRLKRELGTGVFVVCGQNSKRGGIFDYWGYPATLRDDVRRIIDALRSEGA